mmetsp:Transcript_15474/g.62277  ORF Transcript_15474/g.62277 Transcript_15474/m.62277 type:complete len:236 (-) Transcript_15474:486-1193(-)
MRAPSVATSVSRYASSCAKVGRFAAKGSQHSSTSALMPGGMRRNAAATSAARPSPAHGSVSPRALSAPMRELGVRAYGTRPVAASNTKHPKLYTSVFSSNQNPASGCASGAIQRVPIACRAGHAYAAFFWSLCCTGQSTPKSVSLTTILAVSAASRTSDPLLLLLSSVTSDEEEPPPSPTSLKTRTLRAARSRCRKPASRSARAAEAIWRAIEATSRGVTAPLASAVAYGVGDPS